MIRRALKFALILAAAVLILQGTTSQQASAQYYRHSHSHNVYRGNAYRAVPTYRGSSCNTYRSYRPSVSVGFGTVRPPVGIYSGYSYPGYVRPTYARPVYGGYGGGYYPGYSSPGFYGSRGGFSIGIRF